MKRAAVILLLLAAAAAAVMVFDPFSGGGEAGLTKRGSYTVHRQTLKVTLTERGTLKTKNATKLRPGTSAKLQWMIDEGKTVKKGEVLARMETKDAERQFDQTANQITQLEAELKSARTNELIQVDQNKTDIEKAELALEVARVELKKYLESDLPAKERKLQLAIDEARTNVQRETEKLEANRKLREEDFVTQNDVREAELRLKKAQNALETAKMDWQSHQDYERPLETRKKKAAVVEAERGLERARKRAEAQLAAKQATVTQKEVSLKRIKAQYDRQKENLTKMIIKAPTDGTVIYGDPDQPWIRDNIRIGQQVWQGMVLMTLPDPSEMAVMIQVHEADIAKIRKGMTAIISSETEKDKTFEGEISKIDQVANAGRRWSGDTIKRFKVEVSLRGENPGLKTGTSAQVEIQIGEIPDVLAVPIQAVYAKEGKFYCYRVTDGAPERREVEVGRASESLVEIKSGIEEGDKVLLYDPEEAEESGGAQAPGNGGGGKP